MFWWDCDRLLNDCRITKGLYDCTFCKSCSYRASNTGIPLQCYLEWLREGGYSRILRDCQSYVILLLVPIILPLNLLTGLQRIVGGFRIALGLLGLQSELNCNIYSSSHPFAQFLFHWITSGRMGLHGLFNWDDRLLWLALVLLACSLAEIRRLE